MNTEDTNQPAVVLSTAQLGPLVPCPMCDSRNGYTLKDGSTYRWWDVFCVVCCREVDECASDRRTRFGTELPDRWPAADAVWNAAGEHAQALRQALQEADTIMGHDDEHTAWRERWQHLWPWGGPNVEFSGVPAGHSSNHPAGGTSAGTQG